jgi:hypothetical protein
MLSTIPKTPRIQFRHQIALYFVGFLMSIHMKHGYAKVTGSATPPINPAKLIKKGSATDIKNAKHPKKILNTMRNHQGHGFFILLVNLSSRLSNTGIAYI